MACVANKSTTVRKAVNPITKVRRSTPPPPRRIMLRSSISPAFASTMTVLPLRSHLCRVLRSGEQRGNAPALRRLDAEDAHQEPQPLGLGGGKGERKLEGQ